MSSGRGGRFAGKKVWIEGIKFDSETEAYRYLHLKMRQSAGEICGLTCQPCFKFFDSFRDERMGVNKDGSFKTCRGAEYTGDFMYRDLETNRVVVEEVKGFKMDEAYRLRIRIFMWLYPASKIFFKEVDKNDIWYEHIRSIWWIKDGVLWDRQRWEEEKSNRRRGRKKAASVDKK